MIHETAIIEDGAEIGENVSIGPFSYVSRNVSLAANSIIDSHCNIGYSNVASESKRLIIGESAHVRSHSVIYGGSQIGKGLRTGHHVTIRENSNIGEGFQIGTLGDIQGNCHVGNFVKAHSNVHIAMGSRIGNFVWLYPGVVITNDPNPPSDQLLGVTIEDYVVAAVKSTLLPGVTVGMGSLIGAHALVRSNCTSYSLVIGDPGVRVGDVRNIRLRKNPQDSAYPWPKHFSRGYPDEIIQAWASADDKYSVNLENINTKSK